MNKPCERFAGSTGMRLSVTIQVNSGTLRLKGLSCLAVCAIAMGEGLVLTWCLGRTYTALEAGVSPDKLYLHGNNKSVAELICY